MNDRDDLNKTDAITIHTTSFDAHAKTDSPPCLMLLTGSSRNIGRQWVLDKPKMTLGRMVPADIVIDEGGLSKTHASLERVGDVVTIQDLGATNKTSLNNETLEPHKTYLLKNNDQVRAGNLIFKFLQKGLLAETSEKERMQEELEGARSIQRSSLPEKQEASYRSVQIGGRYRTASECGGDWWWHWSKGNKSFALIGDVTGHGAGAALLTSAARATVTTLEDDPTVNLERVYVTLSKALHRCAGGSITMNAFIAEVDLDEARIRYINASHPPPILLPKGAAKNLSWNSLHFIVDRVSGPLGSPDVNFNIGEGPVSPGTRLVLMTDGLIERKDLSGKVPSERTLNTLLLESHLAHATDQAKFLDRVLQQSDALAQNASLDDDITVVAIDFH